MLFDFPNLTHIQEVENTCKGNYYEPTDMACEDKLSRVDEVMKAGFET